MTSRILTFSSSISSSFTRRKDQHGQCIASFLAKASAIRWTWWHFWNIWCKFFGVISPGLDGSSCSDIRLDSWYHGVQTGYDSTSVILEGSGCWDSYSCTIAEHRDDTTINPQIRVTHLFQVPTELFAIYTTFECIPIFHNFYYFFNRGICFALPTPQHQNGFPNFLCRATALLFSKLSEAPSYSTQILHPQREQALKHYKWRW